MKKTLLKAANFILKPFGAKVIKSAYDAFDMFSAVERINGHGIAVNTVIDIGASDGKWSKETMGIFPDASFLAVEPLTEQTEALETLKRKSDRFDYASCVAGETDGQEAVLSVSDDLDGSSIDGGGGKDRTIRVRTIDALTSEKKLDGPFLLKFDTHGYEIPILNGAKNTLKRTNIIIMEVYNFKITKHAKTFHEMCMFLEGLGFCCYDMAGPMLRLYDKAFWQMDLFFCRADSPIRSVNRYR